jgi:2-dehydropantoate 2-reductase
MRSLQSIGIIGAGALGTLYAAALGRAPGTDAFILADGERYERLKAGAFVINDREVTIDVRSASTLESPADLIIVAVKNHHLNDIKPLLRVAAGPDTVLLSVLNGIDSESFLQKTCPDSTVLYCVSLGMDAVRSGRRLSYTSEGKVIIGAADNNPDNPELTAVAQLLDRAGLKYEIPADIHRELWWKLMINIGMNQVSAVTGAPYGVFQRDKQAQAMMEAAMRETVEVAKAEGIDLRDEDITNWYAVLNKLGPEGKTSMLQDMEDQRQTEAPSFGGRLIELAASHGIPVPVNETLVRIIAIRESLYSDN